MGIYDIINNIFPRLSFTSPLGQYKHFRH